MIVNGTNNNLKDKSISTSNVEGVVYEKSSTKESNKEHSDYSKSSDEECDNSDTESSHECNCDMSHGEDGEHKYEVAHTESNNMRKKVPNTDFYDKQMNNKRENERKNEILRKRREEEAKNRAKPVINEASKKMMEKKQGFVKPIFQRAKEIEESKKNKIENLKKGIEEKKAKKEEEEEQLKKKNKKKNKEYNEKDFEEWRINQLKWETEKKKKIEVIKEQNQKNQLDTLSKFYHPSIDKNSESLAHRSKVLKGSDNGINIFDKLYSQNEERQKKLLQKTLESLPDFRPHINKKVPNFMKNRPKSTFSYNSDFTIPETKISTTTRNNPPVTYVTLQSNYNSESKSNHNTIVYQSEKTLKTLKTKGANNSTIETYNNPIIMSNSEGEESEDEKVPMVTEIENHEDVVSKYKKALEIATPTKNVVSKVMINDSKVNEICNISIQSKNTNIRTDNSKLTINKVVPKPKPIPGHSTVYSSDRNKEKIEMYNQKINALLSCLKRTEKKK